jgi:hypothetical protein
MGTMNDNQLRGLVLKKYYDLRRRGPFQWAEFAETVNEDPFFEAVGDDLIRICDQLAEHGLINWKPLRAGSGRSIGGFGEISSQGVDVVEGHTKPPVSISFDHSITVQSSSHVQIGNSNIQTGNIELEKLVAAVNNSTANEAEKAEAKSLLQKLFSNSAIATALKLAFSAFTKTT